MAVGNLEIRMAHLEGAYKQVSARLGTIEEDLRGVRTEIAGLRRDIAGEIAGVRGEIAGEIGGVRTEITSLRTDVFSHMNDLRRELVSRMDRQFSWMLGLLIISILSPIGLRALGR